MKKTDLRVIKTKDNIRRCFFELLEKKPLNDISVKEICEMAKCSRNTFYMHYQYKDNLYEQIVDECIAAITKGFSPIVQRVGDLTDDLIAQYAENFLSGVYANADTLRVIIASDSNSTFKNRLTDAVYATLVASSKQVSEKHAETEKWRIICRFTASGFVGFSIFWLGETNLSYNKAREIFHAVLESPMWAGRKYLPDS